MGLKVSTKGGTFRQAPTGSHVARVIALYDLGTQHNEMYDNDRRQILEVWELPNEMLEVEGIEKPFTISKFYTASLHEKSALRHDLEGHRGRGFSDDELAGFDLKNVLCKPCMLSVVEKNGKSKVASVSALPKGMECPPQFNTEVFFSLEDFDQAIFDSLPDGIRKIIEKSPEYKSAIGLGGAEPQSDPMDGLEDDIPF